MDGRRHRTGGAHSRIHVDQGVRSPFQRAVPRRQDLPVSGDIVGGGRASRMGHPQPQEKGRPLLRPLREGVGAETIVGQTAAHIPGAYLHDQRVPQGRTHRATMPARVDWQMLGAMHRENRAQGAPAHVRAAGRRDDRSARQELHRPADAGHEGRQRRTRIREGCAAARRNPDAADRHAAERGRVRSGRGRRRVRHGIRRA